MSNYRIITDSCCDFPEEILSGLDIDMVHLTLLFRDKEMTNPTDEEIKTMYDALRAGESASTSAVNPEGWKTAIEPVLASGKDALVMAFSSGLSTTYQSAVIASQELMEQYPDRTVKVVDTLAASLGQGMYVWYACKKRDEGMGLTDLAAWVEENKLKLCHWVTIDDLNHLKRGGRVSATTAFVGTMIGIKPIIRVDDNGKLETCSKIRGRKAAIEYLADQLDKHIENCEMIHIAHGDCPGDAAKLEELIRAKRPEIGDILTGYVGGVIGAHTGPGVLVVFFLGDHR